MTFVNVVCDISADKRVCEPALPANEDNTKIVAILFLENETF